MTNSKKLEDKKKTVFEIVDKIKKSSSIVFFDYRGLTADEINELRSELQKINSEIKIYKNSLSKRALNSLKISVDNYLIGSSAISFSSDMIEPIKIITKFAKDHKNIKIKGGIIDGEISDINTLSKLATIPSREGLLTMVAGCMIGIVKNLSICLKMISEQKSE